jgi:predicted RNA binding protein YcfA (HicA-like mRNA interferase family)
VRVVPVKRFLHHQRRLCLAKLPILTAKEAEAKLLKADFKLIRSKGSHRIYLKDTIRIVVPFHTGKTLHPKIVKEVLQAVGEL